MDEKKNIQDEKKNIVDVRDEEIARLQKENEQLRKENEQLNEALRLKTSLYEFEIEQNRSLTNRIEAIRKVLEI